MVERGLQLGAGAVSLVVRRPSGNRVGHDGCSYLPSRSVSSSSDLAVYRASTLLAYWRCVSTISTGSWLASTAAMKTCWARRRPSGHDGSWRVSGRHGLTRCVRHPPWRGRCWRRRQAVTNSGFFADRRPPPLPATLPAFARFDAVVLSRQLRRHGAAGDIEDRQRGHSWTRIADISVWMRPLRNDSVVR